MRFCSLVTYKYTTDLGDPYWAKAKASFLAVERMLCLSCFFLEGDALNIINPLACSLVLPHWFVTDILADIRYKLSYISFLVCKSCG